MVIPDITTDFEDCVDNLEPIILTLRGDTTRVRHVRHAHRNFISLMQPAPAGGDVKQGDVIWQFPRSESAEDIPLGSTITDNENKVWTIIKHIEQVWKSKWTVQARNLTVEAGLDTEVDILRATYASNADGESIAEWAVYALNVRAKFTEVINTSVVEQGADYSEQIYDVILESQLDWEPGANFRLVDRHGQIYNILNARNQNQIDVLPTVRVRKMVGYSSSGIA